MRLASVKVLGIKVNISPKKEILEEIRKSLKIGDKSTPNFDNPAGNIITIVTPNPEQIVLAQGDKYFADILNRADVAIPDGIGVVLATKFLHGHQTYPKGADLMERIPGVEFMENLVEMAAKEGFLVALIGGYEDLAVKALECLKEKNVSLTGVAIPTPQLQFRDGHIVLDRNDDPEEYFQNLAHTIVLKGIQMVFVGLGAPKQEYFIKKLAQELSLQPPSSPRWSSGKAGRNPKKQALVAGQAHLVESERARDDKVIILMSVGGSFSMITGQTPRAPIGIRSIGFEWFWRLLREPWRWRRQLAILTFVYLVLLERFKGKIE